MGAMGTDEGKERSERINRDLFFLLDDADILAETLPEWDEISKNERGIWEFEWPYDLTILRNLQRSRDAGEMSAEQERRHDELLTKLRGLPFEGTGLSLP